MLLFYIDETGNRDPRLRIPRKDGTTIDGDWLYVLSGISLFEHRWHGFEKVLNRHKNWLMGTLARERGVRLDLPAAEIKSNWVRMPNERAKRPFLANLPDAELTRLLDLYYQQLEYHHMHIFAVVVDKRHLHGYMDQTRLHRKSWELLMQLIEQFMRSVHPKHQAIMVNDDVSREVNRSLALKHAYFLDKGTTDGVWLQHICEMPMFVRSELSNGVQLADLCSYNIYRTFKQGNLDYPFFTRIMPSVWSRADDPSRPFSGLYVFPAESPLRGLVEEFERGRAQKMVSGGANPIEPTSGTGQESKPTV
jgi:hypothetical protein